MRKTARFAYDYLKPRRSSLYLFLVLYLPLLVALFFFEGTNSLSIGRYLYAFLVVGSALAAYGVAAPVTRFVNSRYRVSEEHHSSSISRIIFQPSDFQILFLVYVVGSFVAFVYLHLVVVAQSTYLFIGGYFLFTLPTSVAYSVLASIAKLLGISSYRADFFFITLPLSLPITVGWFFVVASALERVALRCRTFFRRIARGIP